MSFNPDPLKQGTEFLSSKNFSSKSFFKKSNVICHPDFVFDNNIILNTLSQKHRGGTLNET